MPGHVLWQLQDRGGPKFLEALVCLEETGTLAYRLLWGLFGELRMWQKGTLGDTGELGTLALCPCLVTLLATRPHGWGRWALRGRC